MLEYKSIRVAVALLVDERQRLLLSWSDSWGAFTLPMTKPAVEQPVESPQNAAVRAASEALWLPTRVVPTRPPQTTRQVNLSWRTRELKNYVYTVVPVEVHPDFRSSSVDHRPLIWAPVDKIVSGDYRPLSPTVELLLTEMIQWGWFLRQSTAGLALIQRSGPGGAPLYLAQWNEVWQRYSLVGGHVEPGESFRQCCVREVAEELELQPDFDFRVAESPLRPTQEYTTFSGSARVDTNYRVELFAVEMLSADANAKVNADPRNRWLTEAEIRREMCVDEKPVSAQVKTVLRLFGVVQGGNV